MTEINPTHKIDAVLLPLVTYDNSQNTGIMEQNVDKNKLKLLRNMLSISDDEDFYAAITVRIDDGLSLEYVAEDFKEALALQNKHNNN